MILYNIAFVWWKFEVSINNFYFQKLPKAPLLEHLSLQQNNIMSLTGLEMLQKTRIQSLILKENPVELDPHYRQT